MASGFLDLDPQDWLDGSAQFAVLPIPYETTVSYNKGTSLGPAAIIAASSHLEDFDEELGDEFHHLGIQTLDPLPLSELNPQAAHEAIHRAAQAVLEKDQFLLGLGGEHGVSSALVRATLERHPNLSVLQIDAHCDQYNAYLDEPFSHASVMRRVVEMGVPVVPVGIRIMSREEHDFMADAGINPIMADTCRRGDAWIDDAVERLSDAVYVTLDIDGLDPAYAPGTGTPVPGGLDWWQVISLLRRVASKRRIVGADIVEVAPIAGQVVTEFLAARLAYRLMVYVAAAKLNRL